MLRRYNFQIIRSSQAEQHISSTSSTRQKLQQGQAESELCLCQKTYVAETGDKGDDARDAMDEPNEHDEDAAEG